MIGGSMLYLMDSDGACSKDNKLVLCLPIDTKCAVKVQRPSLISQSLHTEHIYTHEAAC